MKKRLMALVLLMAVSALSVVACNEVGEYGDEVICGNEHLNEGEVCDGIYFKPGYADCRAFDQTKTWASGTPRCSATCTLEQGTCQEAGQ